MSPLGRLALEHLTAPSASPLQIVELAEAHGWAAAAVLVSPFGPFPQTGGIDLVADGAARREVRRAAERGGVTLALSHPFILSRRASAAALAPALEASAEIGAKGAGLLIYERDTARTLDELAAFCSLAARLGIRPVLEFFGGSAIATLAAADALGEGGASSSLGLCIDLLHLVRSGGRIADLARARTPVVYAQLSDAPLTASMERDTEAAYGRLQPGDGELDVSGFVSALPADVWLGVEVPPPIALSHADCMARAIRIMRATGKLLDKGCSDCNTSLGCE